MLLAGLVGLAAGILVSNNVAPAHRGGRTAPSLSQPASIGGESSQGRGERSQGVEGLRASETAAGKRLGGVEISKDEDGKEWVRFPSKLYSPEDQIYPAYLAIRIRDGEVRISPELISALALDDDEIASLSAACGDVARNVNDQVNLEMSDTITDESGVRFVVPPLETAEELKEDFARKVRDIIGDRRGYLFMLFSTTSWVRELADFGSLKQSIVVREDESSPGEFYISREFTDPNTGERVAAYEHKGSVPWNIEQMASERN